MSTGDPTTPAGPRTPLVQQGLPVFQEVAGHFAATPFLLTHDMLGGLDFEVAGGPISDKVGKPVAAPHTHEMPEVYLLLSPEPGGAVIDVVADDVSYEVTSPGAMLIPAGTVHHFVTKRAEPGSFCLGLLLTGGRDRPGAQVSGERTDDGAPVPDGRPR
ncbi:cupin domain-containing protein [Streptomyces tubercidicus]|uniref:cupin domain-containing protein n=1 Tax=Streptomyces tubercidicus TaxID=47759 RepID=UPI002E1449FF|nr:cupin domain-containing protein [Streptomyces tubercidicus]WSX24480.1 cupin domain-containing protein [Streptomyces tubercidicus]